MKFHQRISIASCLGLAAALPATAWEWVYGATPTADDAFRRVHPVPSCGSDYPGAGYISVGTQDAGGLNPDVYVVYTNLAGGPGWEAIYDIEGLALPDDGTAIVSIPNQGYVFLSNSLNGVWRPALTFIDCRGKVVWSQLYPDDATGQHLWGNDLIRTQSGDPNFFTAPGDFAVAGWWRNGGNEDAFLMRTDAAGNLIWNVAYDNLNVNEVWNALAEAQPVAPALAGDLVAAGRITIAGDLQGLVARVNGNSGALGVGQQCMQHHGQAGSAEIYNSVTRIANFFPGEFAFVGNTRDAAWMEDIWVTRGNTCALTAQARYGNPAGLPPTWERGNDIIEVLVPKPGVAAGSLAIAGDHSQPAAGYDAVLMLLDPALIPIAGASRLFGDFGANYEGFYSLAEDPAFWPAPRGYILAGITQTPWTPGDPQDMYLVHEDPAVFACEREWRPVRVPTFWPQNGLQPLRRFPAKQIPTEPQTIRIQTGRRIC